MYRFALSVLCLASIGCGGQTGSVTREAAYAAYEQGSAAFKQRDYQTALDQLTSAVESGWLNPDAAVDAIATSAAANAALGNFDAANADLEKLKNAPDQGSMWAAKAFILKKQGNLPQATAALQRARRLNPAVKTFE